MRAWFAARAGEGLHGMPTTSLQPNMQALAGRAAVAGTVYAETADLR